MNREERVFSYINSKEYVPLKQDELKTVLDVPDEDAEEFRVVLDRLCASGRVVLSKRGRYSAARDNVIVGRLVCSVRGSYGFVKPEDKDVQDVFVHVKNMGNALHGDIVAAVYDGGRHKGANTGRIKKVIERANKSIVGVITDVEHKNYVVIPDNRAICKYMYVMPQNAEGAGIGDRVVCEILDVDAAVGIEGKVIKRLGAENSLKSIITGRVIESGIKYVFDDETLAQAAALPKKVSEEDAAGRLDLRGEVIFTIDGKTAKDFDDAVSVKELDGGITRIGVHIADVSHYVKEGSACDREAAQRGNSIYFADRVIPMLPERISDGLCSLHPNKDRLTLTVFVDVDADGALHNGSIHESVIRSCARLTYEDINKLLDKSDNEILAKYEDIAAELELMRITAERLKRARKARGAVEFDFPESKIITSRAGVPTDIMRDERGSANSLIEEFMIAANKTVAKMAAEAELPFIYRVHDAPTDEKLDAFCRFINNFGINAGAVRGGDGSTEPKVYERIMEQAHGMEEEMIISRAMLRSMMKAEYAPVCRSHFGLAEECYCHFTSPIRRYPDLVVHRILKLFAHGGLDAEQRAHFTGICAEAAKQSGKCERTAEALERETDDIMKAYYMQQFIGESFTGIISGAADFGIFVELSNTVEGVVYTENMTDDYYEYNEADMSVTGKQSGKCYRIGDEVSVTVAKSDVLAGKISFVLTKDMSFELWRKASSVKPQYKPPKRRLSARGRRGVRKRRS